MKLQTVIILVFNLTSVAQAQTYIESQFQPKNNIYAEITYGLHSHATINYEIPFRNGKKISWHGRLGLGLGSVNFATGGPGLLGGITMLTGKKSSHFEFNAGALFGYDNFNGNTFGTPILKSGYRYQKPTGGFLFRLNVGIYAGGIGLGYSF